MNPVTNIGAINHPKHGEYFIWFDIVDGRYGITRATKSAPHCAYATLEAAFKSKGL